MSEPLKCRFCGAGANDVDGLIFANCGTWVYTYDNTISRSTRCERDALRKRIDEAVKALQDIPRCEVYADDQFGIVDERNEHGEWVQWDDVEDVVKILTGNS